MDISYCCFYMQKAEKSHGQMEIREYFLTDDVPWLRRRSKWKGLNGHGVRR